MTWPGLHRKPVVETVRMQNKCPFLLLLPKPSLKPQAVSPGTGFTQQCSWDRTARKPGVNCLAELILILQNLLKPNPIDLAPMQKECPQRTASAGRSTINK